MQMPKRRGRPPLDANDPSVPVQVRMPGREYDSVYERARRERVSVPEICRRALARSRREDDQED